MNFYILNEGETLQKTKTSKVGQNVWLDLNTPRAAIRRARNLKNGKFKIYTFENWFDNNTFVIIHEEK